MGIATGLKRIGSAIIVLTAGMLGGMSAASAGNAMETGGYTSQPIGHYEFCLANTVECSLELEPAAPVILDENAWNVITAINSHVNNLIRPMNDYDIYGREEVWAYPTDVGDCEDYVLLKRKFLIQKGVSPSNALITVVRKPDGEGHAVLTVRTDKGDFVLDNLHDKVRNWNRTGYTYLKRQAQDHTGRWVSITGARNMIVSALY